MIMTCMAIIFFFFPYTLLWTFTTEDTVVELGTVFLKIVAPLQILLALTMSWQARGAGDTRFIMGAITVGMWGVRVPMGLIFALWFHLAVYYVWTAMIAEWTVRMELLL